MVIMKRILKFLLSLAIGLAVFLIVMHRVGLGNVKDALLLFFNFAGLSVVFLTFLFVVVGVWKWRFILKTQGHTFSFKELAPLWLLDFSMSYLTPFVFFGGELFRMYFTKKKLPSLSWKKTMSSIAIDKLLDATVFFVFLIAGFVAFAFYGRFPTSAWGITAGVFVGALLFLLLFFYFKRMRRESVVEWGLKLIGIKREKIEKKNGKVVFQAEQEVFNFFSWKRKAFWQGLGLTFLRYILLLLRCLVLIFFLTGTLSVLKPLAVYGFANLMALTPLPATLGVLELGEGFAFSVLGLGFGKGTVFSMVWRGGDLLLALVGVVFLIKFGANLAGTKILKFFEKQGHNS